LIPDELDPPDHTKYRALLNPMFAPGTVSKMTQDVRAQAVSLIGRLAEQSGCEFMGSFAKPFPVSIFLRLMGLPLEQMATFLKWEADALHSETMEPKIAAIRAIHDRLIEAIEERRREPRDDLISHALKARIDGRPLTQSELVGFGVMMFLAGLDTVSSALGLFFKHLALHPEQQADLRARPARIAPAVDEMLRAFPVVTTNRRVMQDVELSGVHMKAGDWVTIQTSSATLDPAEHADPRRVDFDRQNKASGVFAYGPHRCLGSHLARLELRIALEEWTSRLPLFHIHPGSKPLLHGGSVFGVDRLELAW
jgi:cytochrome P450